MSSLDRDQLNRYLDNLVRGEANSVLMIEPALASAVERIHTCSDARVGTHLGPDEAAHIWDDLLRQHTPNRSPWSEHEAVPDDDLSDK